MILLYLLFMVLIAGIFSAAMFSYKENVIKGDWTNFVLGRNVESLIKFSDIKFGNYIRLLFFGFNIIILCNYYSLKDFKTILSKVLNYSKVSIIFGCIEFFITNIFKSKILTELYIVFFGIYGAQQRHLVYRGVMNPIQGFTKEPSMFSTSIFYILILFFMDRENIVKNKKWITLGIFLLLFNPTMSSMFYICILLFLYFNFFTNSKYMKYKKLILNYLIIVLFICFICFFCFDTVFANTENYLLKRIDIAIQELKNIYLYDKASYTSEGIRFYGIFYDLKMLVHRPLFGFGLGVLVCNSGIISLLIGSGILGIIIWFSFICNVCFKNEINMYYTFFAFSILILPNIILNDFNTIMCLIIPFILRLFYYNTKECDKEENDGTTKTIGVSGNINI